MNAEIAQMLAKLREDARDYDGSPLDPDQAVYLPASAVEQIISGIERLQRELNAAEPWHKKYDEMCASYAALEAENAKLRAERASPAIAAILDGEAVAVPKVATAHNRRRATTTDLLVFSNRMMAIAMVAAAIGVTTMLVKGP